MRAKLVNESLSTSGNSVDQIIAEIERNPSYKPYARFRGLIGGTLVQLASELGEDPDIVTARIVEVPEYEAVKESTKEYINNCTDLHCMVCSTSSTTATFKFEYAKPYAKKLYGIKQIDPIYIVLSV